MSDMQSVPDRRNDPARLPLSWYHSQYTGESQGQSKHWSTGGPEDEAGQVFVRPQQSGGFQATAEHYDPYLRGSDEASAISDTPVVKSKFRAMVAGEALLRRLQMRPGGTYNSGGS